MAAVDADEEAFRKEPLELRQPLDDGDWGGTPPQMNVAVTTHRFHVNDVGVGDFVIVVLIADKQAVTLVTGFGCGVFSIHNYIFSHKNLHFRACRAQIYILEPAGRNLRRVWVRGNAWLNRSRSYRSSVKT